MAILTMFRHRFYKNDGTPNSGGKVYTYEAGTTTPTSTYTSSSAAVANANPIILDSKGEADIWVVGQIKVNVLESDDTQVTGWPVDNIGSGVSNNDANARWAGTAGGSANALTISPSPSISAYVTGQSFIFKAGASNNSGATTISISGLSAIELQSNGAACAGGEILANNWYQIVLSTTAICQISKIGEPTLAELGSASLAGSTTQIFSVGQMTAAAHAVRSDAIVGVMNLRLVAAAAATNNNLGMYAESNDSVPTTAHPIIVAVPTVNGIEFRSREAGFLSGADLISLADAANYWSKGSLDAEIKTAWLYAIAPAAGGIVWALGGYSGFTRVPTTTTVTDDDYLHLENSSTYTRAATDYCVCVGRIRYQYDTADTPDHTFQTTVLDAPQIMYNPQSDYTRTLSLAADNTSAADISDYSAVSAVVKQSGKYKITSHASGLIAQVHGVITSRIKTGSATYGSATVKATGGSGIAQYNANAGITVESLECSVYLNYGDTIHLGAAITATTGSGNRTLAGGAGNLTGFTFSRED